MALSDWVLVLDLDDTLYKEEGYVTSGIHAVADALQTSFGVDLRTELLQARAAGVQDLWGYACERVNVPVAVKESLLWTYRLHAPNITLDDEIAACLQTLRTSGVTLAILTDGRSLTQRNKISALGLQELPVFISEEFQSQKPDPTRYLEVMARWPGRWFAYMGDNPQKDFVAPNWLGWKTFCLRGDARNIHSQSEACIPDGGEPGQWLDRFSEISEHIC